MKKKFVFPSVCCVIILCAWMMFMTTSPTSREGYFGSKRKFQNYDFETDIQSSVKVLCFVETCAKNLATRALAVKNTWAPRCDKTIFISDEDNSTFPAIRLPGVARGYGGLWSKTVHSFRYLYKHYLNDYHWFMKADDDTYVVVENLKYFLAKHNPEEPHYFGKHFKTLGGYTSGGAGYVISREALRKLEDVFAHNRSPRQCEAKKKNGIEDVLLGRCLGVAGIRPGNTLDSAGRDLFHSFHLDTEVFGDNFPGWYYKYSANPPGRGCSNETITFHYVKPRGMRLLDFSIYDLGSFRDRNKEKFPLNNFYVQSRR